jgi:hypothetical protein
VSENSKIMVRSTDSQLRSAMWKRRALLVALVAAAACVAAVGLAVPGDAAAETEMISQMVETDWAGNPWAAKKLSHLGSWLHVRDVQVMPLPVYDAEGGSESDHLAAPNLDDADDMQKPQLSARPATRAWQKYGDKSAAYHAKTADSLYTNTKSENPDVMGLKSLRDKILGQDHAKKNENDLIFARAARQEAALKKSLHEEAAMKQAKQAHVHLAAPPQALYAAAHVTPGLGLMTARRSKSHVDEKMSRAKAELSALETEGREKEVLICLCGP